MQKKLYFLNEEEKNRILNLHESRTKKQYLISEQLYQKPEWMKNISTKGTLNTEELKTFKNIKPQWDMARPVAKACKTLGNLEDRIVDTDEQIKNIVERIFEIFEKSGHIAYMNTEVANNMGNVMKDFKSIPDLCYGIQISSSIIPSDNRLRQWAGYSGNDNFLKLFWDVFHTQSSSYIYPTDAGTIRQAVFKTIQGIIQKSEDILKGVVSTAVQPKGVEAANTEKSKATVAGWEKFSCVPADKFAKKVPNVDAYSIKFQGGYFHYYYPNGTYNKYIRDNDGNLQLQNATPLDYKCDDKNEIVTVFTDKSTQDTSSSTGSGITNKAVQGIGTTTRTVNKEIPTLLQQVGIEGTSLTQDAINKLYDKLSKKA